MGNSSKATSSLKKKKKGRPSLLDLQKRTLLLQKQEEFQNSLKRKRRNSDSAPDPPNSGNPYLKLNSGRRSTRRNPNPNPSSDEEDDDVDQRDGRREKKLKLVLESTEIDDVRGKRVNSTEKGTVGNPEPSGFGGPTTPLPDSKLLEFILERVQKKDTYRVFAEPVDPEELPDYFDIIEHPMDFKTVKEKLDNGDYANLEQFESDVFLICSNAMSYNSSDTIYYRQARAMQEIAKKDFANLREDSEARAQEPPPKPRRGRPPARKPAAAERVASQDRPDSAGPSGRGGGDSLRGRPQSCGVAMGSNPYGIRMLESGGNWFNGNADFSGFGSKLGWINGGNNKPAENDGSRRSTYEYPHASYQDPPILNTFDDYQNILTPVGLQHEHAYSLSLARFASKLGPTAWKIAANRINQALPPGTPFGPGWVGQSDAASSPSPQPATPTAAPAQPTPDPQQGLTLTRPVLPKLNMHYQMNGCENLNGFSVSNGNNGGLLRNGDLGLNLNLGFQSPGQSGSACVEQKQQPDLALQL